MPSVHGQPIAARGFAFRLHPSTFIALHFIEHDEHDDNKHCSDSLLNVLKTASNHFETMATTTLARMCASQTSRLFLLHAHTPPFVHTLTIPCSARSSRDRWTGVAYASSSSSSASNSKLPRPAAEPPLHDSPPVVLPEEPSRSPSSSSSPSSLSPDASSPQVAARPPRPPQPERSKPTLRSKKAALSLTPEAVRRLQMLLKGPTPQLIRIGVKNKGCAGMSYHLEYVEKPATFDEVVEQDGVKVLIDSKALFSIIGSEMDWKEDKLSSKFAFKNPNIKDACGCGESFNV